ncbi:MAG TPA: hypothetical protein ENF58_04140 [Candidatus Altiarchaeales archaeon]|nr:hypothetical protein [Candidatus Altiarchaeales archaeon]
MEKKKMRKKLTMALISILALNLFLFLVSAHEPEGWDIPDEYLQEIKEITEQMKNEHPKMWMELSRRVYFCHQISTKIDIIMEDFCNNLIAFILLDPPLQNATVIGLLNYFILLLQPLYGIAILLTGMYMLFVVGSPRGRARAKSTLIKLIIGIGLITLTLPIIQAILQIIHSISSLLFSFVPDLDTNIFRIGITFFTNYFLTITFFEPMVGVPFLFISIMLPIAVLVVLAVRYLMIILFTVFFPFTVLLYSFYPTKKIGGVIIKQTFLWALVPIVESLVLISTWITYSTISMSPVPEMGAFIIVVSLLLLIFAPLVTIALMNWIGPGIATLLFIQPVRRVISYFGRTGVKGTNREEGYVELKSEVEK